MRGSIERVNPQAQVQPTGRDRKPGEDSGGRRFTLDGDVDPPQVEDKAQAEDTHPADDERPVGYATEDEAGSQLDLTG